MSINTKLLAEICQAPGAPGHEQRIREIVIREVTPLVDDLNIDNMGNITALKKGNKEKKHEGYNIKNKLIELRKCYKRNTDWINVKTGTMKKTMLKSKS